MPVKFSNATLLLSIGIFLSVIIPHFLFILFAEVHLYTNAWDETTYLTFPAANFLLHQPGYFSNYLTYLLQNLGVSGSYINTSYDVLVILAILFLTRKVFVALNFETDRTLFYAVIVLFGSVLFNYTNPLVLYVFSGEFMSSTSVIIPGRETYASVVRTPEPQFSYLVIALSLAVWAKYKKDWILFMPIPFLYFFIMVGYGFIVLVFLLSKYVFKSDYIVSKEKHYVFKSVLIVLISTVVFSFLYLLAAKLVFGDSSAMIARFGHHYVESRQLTIPISLLVLVPAALFLLMKVRSGVVIGKAGVWAIVFILIIFVIDNLNVVTGFSLGFRQIHDRVISLLAGISLVLVIESCYSNKLLDQGEIKKTIVGLLLVIFILVAGSNFMRFSWQFFIQNYVTVEDAEKMRMKPEQAIVADKLLAAKIPYAFAQTNLTPFSYQNHFLPYDNQLLQDALNASRKEYGIYSIEYRKLKVIADDIRSVNKQADKALHIDKTVEQSGRDGFYFVTPKNPVEDYPDWLRDKFKKLDYVE